MGFFNWANLALVGGWATLAAFAIAAIVAMRERSLKKDETELKLIPAQSRASVASKKLYAKIGAKRHIDTKVLDKDKVYEILLKEIEERKVIAQMIFRAVVTIAVLLAIVSLVWMMVSRKGNGPEIQVALPTASAAEPAKPTYPPEIEALRKELDEEDRRLEKAFGKLVFKQPESIDCQYSRKKLNSFMSDGSQKKNFDDLLSTTAKSDYSYMIDRVKDRRRAREAGFKSLVQDLNNLNCLVVG